MPPRAGRAAGHTQLQRARQCSIMTFDDDAAAFALMTLRRRWLGSRIYAFRSLQPTNDARYFRRHVAGRRTAPPPSVIPHERAMREEEYIMRRYSHFSLFHKRYEH